MRSFLIAFLVLVPAKLYAVDEISKDDVAASSAVADGDDIVGKVKEAPPAALKDAEITVQTKSGGTNKYNSNDWKVVPRYKYLRKKPSPKVVEVERIVEKSVQPKNLVVVSAGAGFDGLKVADKDPNDSNIDVEKQATALFALSYTRFFNETWSATGTVLSNRALLIGAGYSW